MLTKEQIVQYLDSIPEHQMAKDIFVPVLKKLGLPGVKFTGGPSEQGIDIEYYELTQPENSKSYVGIQFKKGNLTYGSGGSKGTVKEVRNQAEEAFEKEIYDLKGKSVGFIGRFIVAVTGEINENARSFIGKARLKGLDRRIDYWDGDRLAEYVQSHWIPEFIDYFNINPTEEEVEEILDQIVDEEYIWENYDDLIKKCRRVKATISGIEFDMLTTIAKLQVLEHYNAGVPFSEFLLEVEKTEESLDSELRNLVGKLEYLEVDDNSFYLKGHAYNLVTLLETIIGEVEEAEEEDTVDDYELFLKVIK